MEQMIVNVGSKIFEIPDGGCGALTFNKEIAAGAYAKEEGVYLVLLASNEANELEEIVVLDRACRVLFRKSLPDGWRFYYFASHINYPLAVVCVSDRERFDWFWGIDVTLGGFVSLNRAY